MIKIRRNVFETNSSMTHSMVLMNDEQHKAWEEGELYADFWRNKFYTREQVEREMIGKYGHDLRDYDDIESFDRQVMYDMDVISSREYEDKIAEWYETYDTHYMVDGKAIHAVGYYGHD